MIGKARHHRRLIPIIPILQYLLMLLMMPKQKALSFRVPPVEYCHHSFTEITSTDNYDTADVFASVVTRRSRTRPLVETTSSSRPLIVTAIAYDDDRDNVPFITSQLARSSWYETIVAANNNPRTTPWSPIVTLPPSLLGCLLLLGVSLIPTPAEAAIPSSLWPLPNTSSSPPITTRNQLSQSYEFQLLRREPVLTPTMEQIRRLQDLQDERLEKCAEEQNEGGTVLFDQCFMFGDMREESVSEKLKFKGVKKRGEGRMMPPTW